jgi:predicted amidohydrolase YtcJ
MKKIVVAIIALTALLSCSSQKKQADFIVTNAKIYTINNYFDLKESFAVKNGKFVAVGTSEEILNKYNVDTIIDLKGKIVYPGFYDAHCHFYGYGLNLQKANLVGTKSFDEVVERVKKHAESHSSEWILGRGWDQNDWEVKEFPINEKLDEVFPDKPMVLTRIDGHALIANTEALKRAGITVESKVEGGKFLKKDGKLTGVLVDNAEELMMRAVPKPDIQLKTMALLEAQKACFAVGLTTVDDAGLPKDVVQLIDELQKADTLKMRIYAMLSPSGANIEHFVKKGPYKTDYLNVRSIKLYADGALGSRGACLLHPYSDDPGNLGFLVSSPEHLKEVCKIAFENDYQINTHAIGDSANRLMLKMYGELLKGENDRRWRIEHAQVLNKNDFNIFKQYSIVPSVQPTHATSDMYWADERLGAKRVKYAYAYKTLLEQNGWLAAGSDFPVEHINPLYGFYAAIARMDLEYHPEGGFQMENAITREQALKAMTIWAAKSNFEENEKGSIEVGKFADFVVLKKDIMVVDVKEIPKVKVLETFVGGVRVY